MKIESIINLLEDLVFEILSWIWYFPYTLARSLVPGGAYRIVAAHHAEDGDKRYKNALSPLVFYFIVFVLLFLITDPQSNFSLERLASLAQLELLIAALSILALPFLFTLVFWLLAGLNQKKMLDRDALRRMFEVQVLLWPTFFATLFLGFRLWLLLDPSLESFGWLFSIVVFAGTLYFLYLEGWSLQLDLSRNEPTFASAAVGGMLAWATAYVLWLLLNGLFGNMFAPFEELLGVLP